MIMYNYMDINNYQLIWYIFDSSILCQNSDNNYTIYYLAANS